MRDGLSLNISLIKRQKVEEECDIKTEMPFIEMEFQ
jgi:hypothetical protein